MSIQLADGVRRFEPYSAYKDIAFPWAFKVPSHWMTHRLKHVACVRPSNVDKKTIDGERQVLLCNYVDVYKNEFVTPDLDFMKATATDSQIEAFTLRAGDVVITKDSETWTDIAVPALVKQDMDGVICGYHLALVRAKPGKYRGDYLFRCFMAEGLCDQFRVAANGITRFGLGVASIDTALFPVPPTDEQRQIAAFLDRETEKIDALIVKKERLIELLQEKRTALISHAVTKGLNPNVPMKDSGVEWLGQIPSHWEVRRTKTVFRLVADHAPEGNVEELLSLYTDIGVRPRKDLEPKGNKATTTDGYFYVKRGDVVVNKLLAWMGAIGVSDYDGVTSPAYDILRKRNPETNTAFYDYLFRCGLYPPIFRSRSRGIMDMRLRLYFDEFGQIPIPHPPARDQNKIVDHLKATLLTTDSLAAKIRDGIEKLREYRTALISAAVTGKIDVREEVA